MTGPLENSEFCLLVSLDFVSGNIEILGKQNSLFPSGPVIKCLILTPCVWPVIPQNVAAFRKRKPH